MRILLSRKNPFFPYKGKQSGSFNSFDKNIAIVMEQD